MLMSALAGPPRPPVQAAAALAASCRSNRRRPLPPSCSVEGNIGLLSNDEVLAVLKDREADKQPVISRATPSEIQVRERQAVAATCAARCWQRLCSLARRHEREPG